MAAAQRTASRPEPPATAEPPAAASPRRRVSWTVLTCRSRRRKRCCGCRRSARRRPRSTPAPCGDLVGGHVEREQQGLVGDDALLHLGVELLALGLVGGGRRLGEQPVQLGALDVGAVDRGALRQDQVERRPGVGVAARVLEDLVLVVLVGLLRGALVDQLDLEVDAGALLDRRLDRLGEDVTAVPDVRRRGHDRTVSRLPSLTRKPSPSRLSQPASSSSLLARPGCCRRCSPARRRRTRAALADDAPGPVGGALVDESEHGVHVDGVPERLAHPLVVEGRVRGLK